MRHLGRILTGCAVLAALLVLPVVYVNRWYAPRSLRPHWQGANLEISAMSDGPFVITHLVVKQPEAGTEAVGRLPEPIVIVEAGRREVTGEDLRSIDWRDYRGSPIPPPIPGTPIRLLYTRPQRTTGTEESW